MCLISGQKYFVPHHPFDLVQGQNTGQNANSRRNGPFLLGSGLNLVISGRSGGARKLLDAQNRTILVQSGWGCEVCRNYIRSVSIKNAMPEALECVFRRRGRDWLGRDVG